MSRYLFTISSLGVREQIQSLLWRAPAGTRVEFKGEQRSLDQNSKMWACLTDVATQLPWHGKKLRPDDWKLIFIDALKRSNGEVLNIVPNTDGTGFVNLSTSSSDLSKGEMSDLIELIHEFGARHEVQFHEPQERAA